MIGPAVLGDHGSDFLKPIETADKAMYKAKQTGRKRVALWHHRASVATLPAWPPLSKR